MKSVRLTILGILIVLLSGTRSAEASVGILNTCSSLFVSDDSSYNYITSYRSAILKKFPVEGTTEKLGFLIQGKLGQSTSVVYLAMDPKNRDLVVIKESTKSAAVSISSFWRELAVTEYLLDIGETVPKILKAIVNEDGSTVIVKEYYQGLTGNELEMALIYRKSDLPKVLSDGALDSLDVERSRLKELFANGDGTYPSFKDWYLVNKLRIVTKYRGPWAAIANFSAQDSFLTRSLERDIFAQDFSRTNLLFDIGIWKWVAFDP